jgi:hypothetical protein
MIRWFTALDPRQLGQVVETCIPCEKNKAVLNRQGGNPNIVHWYRGSLLSELIEKPCILKGRRFIGKEKGNSGPA